MPCVPGGQLCSAHDPVARAAAQAKGGVAAGAAKRLPVVPLDTAEAVIDFGSRALIRRSMQSLARNVIAGLLDKGAVNACVVAANCALQAIDGDERSSKKRVGDLSDEALDAELDSLVEERVARRLAAATREEVA